MNYRVVLNLLGKVLLIEAAFMALPILVALLYQESSWIYFLLPMLGAGMVGLLLSRLHVPTESLYAKEGFVTVGLSWILLSMVGALPFFLSGQIPHYLDAVFEAVSGFTTTGASILADVETLDHCMLFWRSFTNWLGGMGVLVFMLAILPNANGQSIHLLRAESPGPLVSKIMPKMRHSAGVLYLIYLAMTLVEIVLLLAGGMPLFDSLCASFSTAGTGGFSIWNNSMNYYDSYYSQMVIAIFMALFGINFNVFFFLLICRPMTAIRSSEFRWYIAILLGATAIVTFNTLSLYASTYDAFHHAFFTVSSIMTTTGFCTVNFDTWPELSRMIIIFLMFIGGCAGSTAGGLKVSRLVILVKQALCELKRLVHPRTVNVLMVDHKRVPDETLHGVITYLLLYLFTIVFSILLISLDDFSTTTTSTAVFSAINNVGPGLDLVGPIGNYSTFSYLSKFVLCVDMLLGRLELFPIVIMLLPSTWWRK